MILRLVSMKKGNITISGDIEAERQRHLKKLKEGGNKC